MSVEQFITELAKVGGIAKLVSDGQEALRYLFSLIKQHQAEYVMVSNFAMAEELGVKAALEQWGIGVIEETARGFHEAEIGVTGVLAGIADSGTLLLGAEAGFQEASLLPPIHIAFLKRDQIRQSLDEAFADLKLAFAQGHKELVLVTGPSRTADIALTLITGVHGPKELHAVIVP